MKEQKKAGLTSLNSIKNLPFDISLQGVYWFPKTKDTQIVLKCQDERFVILIFDKFNDKEYYLCLDESGEFIFFPYSLFIDNNLSERLQRMLHNNESKIKKIQLIEKNLYLFLETKFISLNVEDMNVKCFRIEK